MSAQNVNLIEVGKPAWRRWMIFHDELKRYWAKGAWRKRRRYGDLWSNQAEAERELQVARTRSQA